MPVIVVPPELWQRLFERVEDRLVDSMVEKVPKVVGIALRSLRGAFARGNVPEAKKAAAALSEAVAENPQALKVLTNPPFTEARAEVPLIEVVRDFLAYEMALIAQLPRPVALPGFFNSSNCLCVIDVRKLVGKGVEPLGQGRTADGAAAITFELDRGPRIWLIRADADSVRDKLVEEYNREFESKPAPIEVLNRNNEEEQTPPPEKVTEITDTRIGVWYPRHDAPWYTIGNDTAGIELFRGKLSNMVTTYFEAQREHSDAWRRAIRIDDSAKAG